MNGTEDGHYHLIEVISRLLTLNPKPSGFHSLLAVRANSRQIRFNGFRVWHLESHNYSYPRYNWVITTMTKRTSKYFRV